MRNSFIRVRPKVWNPLPLDMRNLPKSTFQKKVRDMLFEILPFTAIEQNAIFC